MSIISDLIGGGLQGIASGAADIIKTFKADPNKLVEAEQKIKELENKAKEISNQLVIAIEQEHSKQLETVNATMREESKSEHWLQWSWRPAVGFLFITMCLNIYVVLPYLKSKGLQAVEIPSEVFMAILAILGVASWHRGVKKVEEVKASK